MKTFVAILLLTTAHVAYAQQTHRFAPEGASCIKDGKYGFTDGYGNCEVTDRERKDPEKDRKYVQPKYTECLWGVKSDGTCK